MGKLIENYSLQIELGSGVYSKVFKAFHVVTKQEVAIKMVKADKFKELPKLEEGTINEINTLTSLKPCPNIIRYYDMLKTVNNFYFVYEYCNGGTLEKILKKQNSLGEKQSLLYLKQLFNAFKVLAQHNIMHRDIKPENILLHNDVLKIADFGFCKPLENQNGMADTMLGSPIYMAPEVLKGQPYTMKADVWSLGVVLYRMIFGFCPFESNNIAKLILMLNEHQINFPKNHQISPTLEELLRRMLTKDPKQRADWYQIFTFQITQNGQIFNPYRKDMIASLKASTTGSFNSNKSPVIPRESTQIKKITRVDSPINHESKKFQKMGFLEEPSRAKDSFKSKSPIRGSITNSSMKQEVHIKNHKKCLQLSQLSIEVAAYDSIEAIIIAYILSKSIETQLMSLKESLRKQYPVLNSSYQKQENSFFPQFSAILNEEIHNLTIIRDNFISFLRENNVNVNEILDKKKHYLKSFIATMNKLESKEELSLCHQLLDYIMEDILINKRTYEKLGCEQMCKKIRDKLQQIK